MSNIVDVILLGTPLREGEGGGGADVDSNNFDTANGCAAAPIDYHIDDIDAANGCAATLIVHDVDFDVVEQVKRCVRVVTHNTDFSPFQSETGGARSPREGGPCPGKYHRGGQISQGGGPCPGKHHRGGPDLPGGALPRKIS